ncbi:MAG: hypothetical protein JJT94_13865 [Bernardetiaceae bacterium]|nr:hypothetical protein [Bernardetiaceae bacterium]
MNRQEFIEKYKHLFWYLDKQKLTQISDAVLVEFILNYGDLTSVKELIAVFGIEKVAQDFANSVRNKRHNYFPQVKNFFELYFQKHVPQYPF